jgi:hypothetical protein
MSVHPGNIARHMVIAMNLVIPNPRQGFFFEMISGAQRRVHKTYRPGGYASDDWSE